MPHRTARTATVAATAAMAAALIALAGCSSPAVLEVTSTADESPALTAEPTPTATDSADAGTSDSSTDDTAAEPAVAPGQYIDYYDGAIDETPGLKVLFFHASWCPKCRALDADITANTVPGGMTIFKVDFDTALDLRQTYGVTLQTTIVYVDDDGDVLAKGVLYNDTTLDALLAAAP